MKRTGKATREHLREHNLHLLLRAVAIGEADSRAALAQYSGLAKPTVSELVSELLALGLLAEEGRGPSTESGGKPPRLLRFVPTARQVIGVSVDSLRISALLANLDGEVVAQHYVDLDGARGDDALAALFGVVNGLVAQLDAPLLCLGVGVPGAVVESAGLVQQSPSLNWRDLPLVADLAERYRVPAYLGNSTELAALAQHTFAEEPVGSLVTVLVGDTVEVGMVLGDGYHAGSDVHDIQIALPGGPRQAAGDVMTLAAVRRRAAQLAHDYPESVLVAEELTYLDIRQAARDGDGLALALTRDVGAALAVVCAWLIALLRPERVTFAGPVVDLGPALLDHVCAEAPPLLGRPSLGGIAVALAARTSLTALGAVAHALQRELGVPV